MEFEEIQAIIADVIDFFKDFFAKIGDFLDGFKPNFGA
jgi:hypothetical protein